MKKDQYFPTEVNMMSDDEICRLTDEIGMKVFGVYYMLLIESRKRDDCR